jgi:archaetidylinositol phosphate synthase
MIGSSWTHKLARIMVRPLVNTPITPNHLTAVRLLVGLASCWYFSLGTRTGDITGGWIWLLSAFLDRADGELARISGKTSAWGHTFDYYADEICNALFFLAIGIGFAQKGGALADWSIAMGAWTGAGLLICGFCSEQLERLSPPGQKAYSGIWGFDFDDMLYLLAPLAWLDVLSFVLVAAALVVPIIAVITGVRFLRKRAEVLATRN